jgi:hypothetical protein
MHPHMHSLDYKNATAYAPANAFPIQPTEQPELSDGCIQLLRAVPFSMKPYLRVRGNT